MSISNIDDLLLGGKTSQHPETPENQSLETAQEIEEVDAEIPKSEEDTRNEDNFNADEAHPEDESGDKPKKDYDDYGNVKEPENEVIRERLARQARKHEAEINALREQLAAQGANQQIQQAAKDFEFDPDAKGDWQHQLATFVKQTVNSMGQEQEQQQIRQEEAKVQQEFEGKFRIGMNKFDDFSDVIGGLSFEIPTR